MEPKEETDVLLLRLGAFSTNAFTFVENLIPVLRKEQGRLPHDIARTLTTRRICLGHSISSILI